MKKDALLVSFREDSITRVSRQTLSSISDALGFDQTQTVHLALARLREDVLGPSKKADKPADDEEYPPLTEEQEVAIRSHAPRIGRGWKKLSSKSLF
jgi:hypothetical protein